MPLLTITACGDNWFYGGEIAAIKDQPVNGFALVGAMTQASTGQIRIFGSAVRAKNTATGSTGTVFGHGGLFAWSGTIHMHGGIVSFQSENQSLNQSVYGVRNQGGFIHTPDTAFSVQASGSGVANRIQGFTTAQSPFLWPNGNTPPAIESNSDADLLVEIDCASDGNCNGGGDQTHLMIYNASCNIDGP